MRSSTLKVLTRVLRDAEQLVNSAKPATRPYQGSHRPRPLRQERFIGRSRERACAEVTGVDLAPGLIETARRLAVEEGLEIAFEVGDVEALPVADASFDVVSSSMGVIFAPDHEAVAGELARVTKPGGRVGFTA